MQTSSAHSWHITHGDCAHHSGEETQCRSFPQPHRLCSTLMPTAACTDCSKQTFASRKSTWKKMFLFRFSPSFEGMLWLLLGS